MNGSLITTRRRRRAAVDADMIFVVVMLTVQMWLLTATLESYLAGHDSVALPGCCCPVSSSPGRLQSTGSWCDWIMSLNQRTSHVALDPGISTNYVVRSAL